MSTLDANDIVGTESHCMCNETEPLLQNATIADTHFTNERTHQTDVNAYPASFYSDFISEVSKSRLPSPSELQFIQKLGSSLTHVLSVRELLPLEFTPGIISMLAGKPNPTMFPIASMSITVRSPHSKEGGPSEKVITIDGPSLTEALQYGPTAGSPDAVKWYKGLQEVAHKRPPSTEWSLSMGSGSQDVIYKARLPISVFIIVVTPDRPFSPFSIPENLSWWKLRCTG
jgi:tryptophan aminotransferase